ncbi:hypothetical protein [Ruegeria meonggei]|uniref:hypothetical protein n=1 Tax=Ruegeria meonggei TaxID=1446476 RepID=UPI00366C20E8
MVARGRFFLYDSIVPALEAGKYRLQGDLKIEAEEDGVDVDELAVRPLQTHFNVTAPRLKLPPDQALMTFPPANSEGAYEARLPQIVLKKKTLPWDRKAAPDETAFGDQITSERTPWLALVVIAEGEGQIEHDIPWQDCVSEGVDLPGDKDVPTATRLSVPVSVVRNVFPTVEDLPLLTHVREVNIDDTEAAMGDDDGFLAVVISNRMPQFDRENCRPKAYTACLINLEGQLGELPEPLPPRNFFDLSDLVFSTELTAVNAAISDGAAIPLKAVPEPRNLDVRDGDAMAEAIRRGEVVFHDGALFDRASANEDGVSALGPISSAAMLDGDFSALESGALENSFQVKGVFGGFSIPPQVVFQERILRFPVLTSWRFTCSGAGSFEQLMRNLDVGLLGRRTGSGFARPLADCTPDRGGADSGAAPSTRLPLDVAESGHLTLPYRTRVGDGETAWYRGPFSPVRVRRDIPGVGDDALAHVSDHLRLMTPSGEEDVSLAVAFETGRLLALSQPSFIAALKRWRAERFGAARAKTGLDFAVVGNLGLFAGGVATVDPSVLENLVRGRFARALEADLIRVLAEAPEKTIATLRPRVDAGNPVPNLEGDPLEFLVQGLELDPGVLEGLKARPTDTASVTALMAAKPLVSGTGEVTLDRRLETELVDRLDVGLKQLVEFAIGADALASGDLGAVGDIDDLDIFLEDRLERNRR